MVGTPRLTTKQLWKRAGGDPKRNDCDDETRARYLALMREHGFIYGREDGATVYTDTNPRRAYDAEEGA